ncbi:hypothetical protein [Streptomyces sp. NPDC094032]|uniref:hypothetical protein n=1 Tax=Streptomyces sp. NPDC094032 TaxID=3155308 RepID=UPI00332EB75E
MSKYRPRPRILGVVAGAALLLGGAFAAQAVADSSPKPAPAAPKVVTAPKQTPAPAGKQSTPKPAPAPAQAENAPRVISPGK